MTPPRRSERDPVLASAFMVGPAREATKGATRDSLRRHNLATVLRRVHRGGPQSRSALTAATGLNRSTIGALVAELVECGLVEEGEPEATGSAGRPSPLVRASTDHVVAAAVDIGTKWLTVAIGGIGGTLVTRVHRETNNDGRPYEETIAELCDLLDEVVGDLLPTQHLFAVGIAAPGVVRAHDGFVHFAPNLGWREVNLGADLAAHLGDDIEVFVANEAHLGARAEHLRGAGAGVEDLIYLSSEIGVGGGTIIAGRLQLGADGYSGEIGHIPVNTGPDATSCRCGSVGCLEAETGALALLALTGHQHTDHLSDAVRGIIATAAAGDEDVQRSLHEIGVRLGRGLAGMVNLLNPRRTVLGGYFADAFEFLAAGIDAELAQHTLSPSRSGVTIVPAALQEDSALLGALEIALEPLLLDPARSPAAAA